jgi:hypothetical protein
MLTQVLCWTGHGSGAPSSAISPPLQGDAEKTETVFVWSTIRNGRLLSIIIYMFGYLKYLVKMAILLQVPVIERVLFFECFFRLGCLP